MCILIIEIRTWFLIDNMISFFGISISILAIPKLTREKLPKCLTPKSSDLASDPWVTSLANSPFERIQKSKSALFWSPDYFPTPIRRFGSQCSRLCRMICSSTLKTSVSDALQSLSILTGCSLCMASVQQNLTTEHLPGASMCAKNSSIRVGQAATYPGRSIVNSLQY